SANDSAPAATSALPVSNPQAPASGSAESEEQAAAHRRASMSEWLDAFESTLGSSLTADGAATEAAATAAAISISLAGGGSHPVALRAVAPPSDVDGGSAVEGHGSVPTPTPGPGGSAGG